VIHDFIETQPAQILRREESRFDQRAPFSAAQDAGANNGWPLKRIGFSYDSALAPSPRAMDARIRTVQGVKDCADCVGVSENEPNPLETAPPNWLNCGAPTVG